MASSRINNSAPSTPAPLLPGASALGRVPKRATTGSYCDHSGWGSKQGSIVKSWKRRYFVLKGIELIYFAERSPSGKGVDEKGRVKVADVEFTPAFRNALIVIGALKNQKLILQVETDHECKDWYAKLKAAVAKQQQNIKTKQLLRESSSSSNRQQYAMAGWLLKEGQNFKTWKRRYMTLAGTLLQYRMAEGEPPLGEVDVRSVNVNASRKFALDIYTDNNRILRIAAESFEVIEAWDRALAMALHRRPLFGEALSDQPAPFLGLDAILDVDCDGWLYVRGLRTTSWKKKHFTLKDSLLRYSDNPGENARGEGTVIDLKLGLEALQFEIKLDDGKPISVMADSKEAYDRWMTALCELLDRDVSMLEFVTDPGPSGRFLLKAVSAMSFQIRGSERLSMGARPSDLTRPAATVRKMGWLRKEGQRMKSWKRRYFVLDGCKLQYYETNGMRVLKGQGEVDHVEANAKHANGLDIHFKNGRVLRVTADSVAEIRDWLDTLKSLNSASSGNQQQALKPAPLSKPLSTLSSMSSSSSDGGSFVMDPFEFARGWLLKEGKNFKSWKQRFFILHGTTLTYRSGVSEQPLGSGQVLHVAYGDARPFALDVHLSSGRLLALVAMCDEDFLTWCTAFKSMFEWQHRLAVHRSEDADSQATDFDNDDDDAGHGSAEMGPAPLLSMGCDPDDLEELEEMRISSGPAKDEAADSLAVTANFNDRMVICSGWLRKEGGHVKSWKERFFTLYGTLLRYFKTENGPMLGSSTIVHVMHVLTRKHCFEITLDSGRKLLVLAESEGEADRWMKALRAAIVAARQSKALGSSASSSQHSVSKSATAGQLARQNTQATMGVMARPGGKNQSESSVPVKRALTRAPPMERIVSENLLEGRSSSADEDDDDEGVYEV